LSGLSDRRVVAGWVAIALLGVACGTGQHRSSAPVRSVVALPSGTTLPLPSSAPPSQTLPSSPPSSVLPSPSTSLSSPPTSASPPSGASQASVMKQIALAGSGADAIAIDSDVAYVVDGGAASTVSMLDLTTDVVSKSIPVGAAPVAVAVDPVLHTAYVVNAALHQRRPWVHCPLGSRLILQRTRFTSRPPSQFLRPG
jgi:hypothetical protein